jgi:osmoprotectant transport system permease protein
MRTIPLIRNRPLFVLVVFLALAIFLLPFLSHAQNRLVSGQSVWLLSLPVQSLGLTLIPILALVAGIFLRQSRLLLSVVTMAALLLIVTLCFVAGTQASLLSGTASSVARISFGSGFWVMLVTIALILADTLSRAGYSAATRLLFGGAAVLTIAIMIGSGHLDSLSVMKEYASKADVFWQAVIQHIVIVFGALLPTLLIGVPLGVLAFRSKAFGKKLLNALNVIQTVPSIALFGLLMGPLSALAMAFPALKTAGISGIGLAPAIIALTLYCLLPIVRNTMEGLVQVPRHVVDAARGMGMTDRQILWKVQVPLALPVFISGLRVTLVQAIGLAAIAALIGAGGLGNIMFQGLFSNALDLVLLGAIPIIALVVVIDSLFRFGVDRMNGVG